MTLQLQQMTSSYQWQRAGEKVKSATRSTRSEWFYWVSKSAQSSAPIMQLMKCQTLKFSALNMPSERQLGQKISLICLRGGLRQYWLINLQWLICEGRLVMLQAILRWLDHMADLSFYRRKKKMKWNKMSHPTRTLWSGCSRSSAFVLFMVWPVMIQR